MTDPSNPPRSNPLKCHLTVIELEIINAKQLYNSDPSEVNEALQKFCRLQDNSTNSGSAGGGGNTNKLKDYTSPVWPQSVILWIGKLKKGAEATGFGLSMDAIEIVDSKESTAPGMIESKFFEGHLQVGSARGILAWTRGNIEKTDVQDYVIYFTLTNPEGASRQFKLDPKLKGDTGDTVTYLIRLRDCLEAPDDSISISDGLRQKIEETREEVERELIRLKK